MMKRSVEEIELVNAERGTGGPDVENGPLEVSSRVLRLLRL
jgi:hypothetical protein